MNQFIIIFGFIYYYYKKNIYPKTIMPRQLGTRRFIRVYRNRELNEIVSIIGSNHNITKIQINYIYEPGLNVGDLTRTFFLNLKNQLNNLYIYKSINKEINEINEISRKHARNEINKLSKGNNP